jgi:perosamine synthetase
MTNLQAAVGVAQMEKIDSFIARKRELAAAYNERLAGVKGITPPPEAEWAFNVYWMYSILVDEKTFGCDAATLIAWLKQNQIDSRPFFTPIHENPPHHRDEAFPISTRLAQQGINLPSTPNLDEATITRITDAIRARGGR